MKLPTLYIKQSLFRFLRIPQGLLCDQVVHLSFKKIKTVKEDYVHQICLKA